MVKPGVPPDVIAMRVTIRPGIAIGRGVAVGPGETIRSNHTIGQHITVAVTAIPVAAVAEIVGIIVIRRVAPSNSAPPTIIPVAPSSPMPSNSSSYEPSASEPSASPIPSLNRSGKQR